MIHNAKYFIEKLDPPSESWERIRKLPISEIQEIWNMVEANGMEADEWISLAIGEAGFDKRILELLREIEKQT